MKLIFTKIYFCTFVLGMMLPWSSHALKMCNTNNPSVTADLVIDVQFSSKNHNNANSTPADEFHVDIGPGSFGLQFEKPNGQSTISVSPGMDTAPTFGYSTCRDFVPHPSSGIEPPWAKFPDTSLPSGGRCGMQTFLDLSFTVNPAWPNLPAGFDINKPVDINIAWFEDPNHANINEQDVFDLVNWPGTPVPDFFCNTGGFATFACGNNTQITHIKRFQTTLTNNTLSANNVPIAIIEDSPLPSTSFTNPRADEYHAIVWAILRGSDPTDACFVWAPPKPSTFY